MVVGTKLSQVVPKYWPYKPQVVSIYAVSDKVTNWAILDSQKVKTSSFVCHRPNFKQIFSQKLNDVFAAAESSHLARYYIWKVNLGETFLTFCRCTRPKCKVQKVNQFKARATKDSSTMTSGRPHQPSLFCFGRNSCGKANSTLVSKAISFAASSLKGGGGLYSQGTVSKIKLFYGEE